MRSSPQITFSHTIRATALIDALNTAYDVSETRRYWKTRSLAIGLTFSVGCLLVIALCLLFVALA